MAHNVIVLKSFLHSFIDVKQKFIIADTIFARQ